MYTADLGYSADELINQRRLVNLYLYIKLHVCMCVCMFGYNSGTAVIIASKYLE